MAYLPSSDSAMSEFHWFQVNSDGQRAAALLDSGGETTHQSESVNPLKDQQSLIINVKRKISIHIIVFPTRLYFEIRLACLSFLNFQTVLAPGRQMTVNHHGKDKEDIYSPSCEYISSVEIFWILERVERQTWVSSLLICCSHSQLCSRKVSLSATPLS